MFLFRKKSRDVATPPSSEVAVEAPAVAETGEAIQSDASAVEQPEQPARRRRRPNAARTRLMGYDSSDGRVVDLFNEDQASDGSGRLECPVGLVMIVKGPGFGNCFALNSGLSQIGRGEDQAVQLDFGDTAVSRTNHAAIVYDPKERTFLLGHGGKSNIVRLNGKPVVSTANLKNDDEIEIGETRMRFVALCSKKFDWADLETDEGGDDDDMEIA